MEIAKKEAVSAASFSVFVNVGQMKQNFPKNWERIVHFAYCISGKNMVYYHQ